MKLIPFLFIFNFQVIFCFNLNKNQIKNQIFQLFSSNFSQNTQNNHKHNKDTQDIKDTQEIQEINNDKLYNLYKEYKEYKRNNILNNEENKSQLELLLDSIHIDILTSKSKNNKNQNIKHVLQILTDDQGWSDIGYNDNTFITPTIDFLANNGIKLNNFYTHCTCTPARASLITGRYAIKTGLQDGPVVPGERRNLPVGMKTMPEYFKEAGYRTLLIGKWHLGQEFRNMTPNERGYDYFFGNLGGAIDHFSKDIGVGCGTKENDYHDVFSDKCKYFNAYDFQENGIPYFDQDRFDIDILAEKSQKAILEHNTSIPLFFSFHPNVPHAPIVAPQSYIDLCDGVSKGSPRSIQPYFRQRICAMVTSIDFAILKIILSLYLKDMLESTLIFYLSDNGGFLEAGSSNYPFREGKGSLYEGGIRVPAFMYGHGIQSKYATNKNHTDLFHISDVLPTLLGYAGLYSSSSSSSTSSPSSSTTSSTLSLSTNSKLISHFDGYNHWDNLVLGRSLTRTSIPINAASLAVGLYSGFIQQAFGKTWKYMFNPNVLIYSGLNPPAHHAPKYRIEGEFLYDLTDDPLETKNLIPYIDHFTHTNIHILEVLNLIRFKLLAFRSTGVASQLKRLPVDIVIRPSTGGCWLPLNSEYRNNITCPVPTPITPDNVFAEYDIPSLVRPMDPSVASSLSIPSPEEHHQTVHVDGNLL